MKTQNYLSSSKMFFIVVAIYFCSMQASKAQYHPLIESNKYWDATTFSLSGAASCGYAIFTYKYFFEGDTLINNIWYNKLKYHPPIYTSQFNCCPDCIFDTMALDYSLDIFFREDTTAKQVYRIIYDSNTSTWHESLFYDFGMLPGDTLSSYMSNFTIIADSTANILLSNGEVRHAIYYHDISDPVYPSVLIEGIGSLYGFEFGLIQPTWIGAPAWSELNCVTQNAVSLYSIGNSCYGTLDLKEPNNNVLSFTVTHNHHTNNIDLTFTQELAKKGNQIGIEIIDLSGRIVYSNHYTTPPTNIITIENVSINHGIYLIKLKTQYYENTKLFIKQ